jgi:hypothetical protein
VHRTFLPCAAAVAGPAAKRATQQRRVVRCIRDERRDAEKRSQLAGAASAASPLRSIVAAALPDRGLRRCGRLRARLLQ